MSIRGRTAHLVIVGEAGAGGWAESKVELMGLPNSLCPGHHPPAETHVASEHREAGFFVCCAPTSNLRSFPFPPREHLQETERKRSTFGVR